MTIKLNEKEKKILTALVEHYDSSGWGETGFYSFKGISNISDVPIKDVRRNVRSLARKGLAEYQKGLVDEDGAPAGAGYSATKAGAMLLNACKDCKAELACMVDGRCDRCWENRKCTKCGKAYRDHETDWDKGGYKTEFEFAEPEQMTL